MAPRIRLRQICMVVERLEPVLDRLVEVLALRVCHGKGDLTRWGVPRCEPPPFQAAFFAKHGVTGALLPIGDTFLEVIAPLREDTAAARYLKRRGPGGYLVVTETDDTAVFRARAEAEGVRIAGTVDYPTYHEVQMDPRDVGGAMLSFGIQREGRPFDGGWFPAGADWPARAAPGWSGIASATLAVADPAAVAARWSGLIGVPVATRDGTAAIDLGNAALVFAPGTGGDRLDAIGVRGSAFREALGRAAPAELAGDGRGIVIGGLTFREADPCN